jgi:prephenate dehydrogenase
VSAQVVGIFGTGLIGGSIGLRLRAAGTRAIGYDADAQALDEARRVGAIDEAVTHEELYAQADTIVIAVHLDGTLSEIARLSARPPERVQLIVDVASVKRPVCAAAERLARFVATHPMAGSERSGAAAARADLFESRTWAYVPSAGAGLDERARSFIASLGGVPFAIGAEEHDRIVAFTSHVPQLLAWAYADQARERFGDACEPLAGAAARELLRLGRSEMTMWREILRANRANVARELRAFIRRLDRESEVPPAVR